MHSRFPILDEYNNNNNLNIYIFSDAREILVPQDLSKEEEYPPVSKGGYNT